MNELQEVNNWIPFGLNVGVHISRLEAIEKERPTIEERRTQLFIYWQKQVVPTWSAVVKALKAIGMRRLASDISQKHGTVRRYIYKLMVRSLSLLYVHAAHLCCPLGVPLPKLPDDKGLEQLLNLSEQGVSEVRTYWKEINTECPG